MSVGAAGGDYQLVSVFCQAHAGTQQPFVCYRTGIPSVDRYASVEKYFQHQIRCLICINSFSKSRSFFYVAEINRVRSSPAYSRTSIEESAS